MVKFRRFILTILILLVCFIVQTVLLPHIAIADVAPNLMLIFVVTFSFLYGEKAGILLGFLAGFLCDTQFGGVIGFTALVLAVIGYACGRLGRQLYMQGIGFPVLAIAVSDLVYSFLGFVFLFLIRNRMVFRQFFFSIMLPEAIYTAALSLIIYPLLMLIHERFMEENRAVILSQLPPETLERKPE